MKIRTVIKNSGLLLALICLLPIASAETQVELNDLNTLFGSDLAIDNDTDARESRQGDGQFEENDNRQEPVIENNTVFDSNDLSTLLGGEIQVSEQSDEQSGTEPEENTELLSGMTGQDTETGELIELDNMTHDLPDAFQAETGLADEMLYMQGHNPDVDKNLGESEVYDPEQLPIAKARIGQENRFKVNVKKYPYTAIGRVTFSNGSGTRSCSGALLGRRIVLTNGHCVYDQSNKKFYSRFKFSPGFQDNKATHGTYYAAKAFVAKGYVKGKSEYDWAFLVLSKKAGDKVGWLGAKTFSRNWLKKDVFRLSGYPSNYTGNAFRTGQQVAHVNCAIHSVRQTTSCRNGRINQYACRYTTTPITISHTCDTGQGSSGAPIFGSWKGRYYVVAVTHSGHGPRNDQRMNSCNKPEVGKCMNYAASYTWMNELRQLLKKYP